MAAIEKSKPIKKTAQSNAQHDLAIVADIYEELNIKISDNGSERRRIEKATYEMEVNTFF